jgi:thiosulfate sulfurtransferase
MTTLKHCTIDQAREWADTSKAQIIDVRSKDAYQDAHIPGAINLNDETVTDFVSTADKDQCYVLHCYHGFTSQNVGQYLLAQGFTDIYSMDGGITAWQDNDYPLERSQ